MPDEPIELSSSHSTSGRDQRKGKRSAGNRSMTSAKPAVDNSGGQAQQEQLALIEQLRRELAEVREAGHAQETRLREMTERQNKMIIAAEAATTARLMTSRGNSSSSSITSSSGSGSGSGSSRAKSPTILPRTSLAQDLVDDAVESSLSAIKEKLDASLLRRGELRDTMGELSRTAVEAHVAKLEKAEARHQEELQALRVVAEKARAEAVQAKKEAEKAKAEAGGVVVADGTEAEGNSEENEEEEQNGDALGTTSSAAPAVPALTAAQLSAIQEATSRENEYVSQLETARDALNKMREKLSEAQARQNEEAVALKTMSQNAETNHQEQLDTLRKTHRAQMLRLVAASRMEGDRDENPEALANDADEAEESDAAPKVSAAMVALQAMTADMELHEETSRQQLQIMQERLAETEKVHREQLESMGDRHRRELEAAAVGTTARAMTMAITDSAALSAARKQEAEMAGEMAGKDAIALADDSEKSIEIGDSASTKEDAEQQHPMTARRALHDFQHSTNEFAQPPSPSRLASNANANANASSSPDARDNAVDELKALADAARESHAREMQDLREEHRAEIERIQRSAKDGTGGGGEQKTPSSSDSSFLAMQQECDALRARLAAYEALESDSLDHNTQAQVSARAAVLRPLVRGLHLDGLKRGFTALNSERKLAEEEFQLERLKMGAARTLRCLALRSGRDLLRLGWSKWRSMVSSVAHDLRTALAVQTAVSESGDAVRAQGLELYCVELQQRMKEMQEDAAEQEQLMDELHDMDWPRVVLKQKRTIRGLQEQAVALKQEIDDERAAFARAMNKAMSALNGDGKKKKGRGRSSGGDSKNKNAHNLQEFITDISWQVSRHREEVLEWQRRHKRSTRAWVSCFVVLQCD